MFLFQLIRFQNTEMIPIVFYRSDLVPVFNRLKKYENKNHDGITEKLFSKLRDDGNKVIEVEHNFFLNKEYDKNMSKQLIYGKEEYASKVVECGNTE